VSDDDPAIQRIHQLILNRHGFAVLAVPGGRGDHTLALCREFLPDLLITDVNKPGMRGPDLVRAIRHDPAIATTPVLMVTAMDERHDRHTLQGADDYVVKPFTAESLIYRVVALLARAQPGPFSGTLNGYVSDAPFYHPITGLPGPYALAEALPTLTGTPGWGLLTIAIRRYIPLLRSHGVSTGEAALLRLTSLIHEALVASGASHSLVAHPAYDWRITISGNVGGLAALAPLLAARFGMELRRMLPPADPSVPTGTGGLGSALDMQLLTELNHPLATLGDLWDALNLRAGS
jgi:CheY-like chemotaxis protein